MPVKILKEEQGFLERHGRGTRKLPIKTAKPGMVVSDDGGNSKKG